MSAALHSLAPAKSAAIALVLASAFSTEACADSNLNCDAYAGAAVAQNQQNITLNCGFTGAGWLSDFNAHRNWCLSPGVQITDISIEDQNRQAALAQCATKAQANQQACSVYAQTAINAAQNAQAAGCGFSGSAWTLNFNEHFSWCVQAQQTERDSEASARHNQLVGCMTAKNVPIQLSD